MQSKAMDMRFEASENEKYGAVLKISDVELADEFDDFLNESCYVFSDIRLESDCVYFYFGQAGCIEKIRDLLERFNNTIQSKV